MVRRPVATRSPTTVNFNLTYDFNLLFLLFVQIGKVGWPTSYVAETIRSPKTLYHYADVKSWLNG